MDRVGHIEIRIGGKKGNQALSPDNFDVREIKQLLEDTENLLFPHNKKDRPILTYQISEGSVRNIFKTSVQYIISFNAVLGGINQAHTIDFLDIPTAKAFESFQEIAIQRDYVFSIFTSLPNTNEVMVSRDTAFFRSLDIWLDTEFYFYGKVTDMGGKEKANIHLSTDEFGNIKIDTPMAYLASLEANYLYKTVGVRAIGKQNSQTGEIDRTSLKWIEIVDYSARFEREYLDKLRQKAKKNWPTMTDADDWLRQLRGYDE